MDKIKRKNAARRNTEPWTWCITELPRRASTTRTPCGTSTWRRRRTTARVFTLSLVSNTPNHMGVICTNGTGCAPGTRNLLDLFQVKIDLLNGLAAIVYVDDTLTKYSSGNPLAQTVLAQQQ